MDIQNWTETEWRELEKAVFRSNPHELMQQIELGFRDFVLHRMWRTFTDLERYCLIQRLIEKRTSESVGRELRISAERVGSLTVYCYTKIRREWQKEPEFPKGYRRVIKKRL